jgi:hypothetical protein
VCVCVCVCVSVTVCERKREKECVLVCVCLRVNMGVQATSPAHFRALQRHSKHTFRAARVGRCSLAQICTP